jgi:hypothetical protein
MLNSINTIKRQRILNISLIIILIIFTSNKGYSQNFKKEKRIYMLDITKSMWGLGSNPDIFDEVKEALYDGIENIKNPETIITIIPFQATYTYEKLPTWTFNISDGKFVNVKKTIDSYNINTVPPGYTDIYSALEKAKKHIDRNRVNYIFLLTDGEQSKVPSSQNRRSTIKYSQKDLENSLNNWCRWSKGKDTYLFYVMLTEQAKNENVIKIVKKQCNSYVTVGTNMNIAFIKPVTNTKTLNLVDEPEYLEIDLSANDWGYIPSETQLKLKLNKNKIFELANRNVTIKNHKVRVELRRYNDLSFDELRKKSSINNTLKLTISTSQDVEIINPTIDVIVKNKKEKVLKLEFIE